MKALVTIYTIWLREFKRFIREPVRVITIFAQPLAYLLIVGTGIASSLTFARTPAGVEIDYLQFMYPGIIGMSVLFTSVFSAVSIMWDREFGFLKEVLVAPVPRWAVAAGKALGGSTVAMLQGTVLLLLAPFLGVVLSATTVVQVLGVLFLTSFTITSLGIAIASRMESLEGFQMIMNFLVMPMFFLSGAMFPLVGAPGWMQTLMRLNPLTYGVDALRNVFYAGTPLAELLTQFSLGYDLLVLAAVGAVLAAVAAVMFTHQKT